MRQCGSGLSAVLSSGFLSWRVVRHLQAQFGATYDAHQTGFKMNETMQSRDSRLRAQLGEPSPQRIAIFRALALGDLLCAAPALRALRAALPEAAITLIGLPWARGFVSRFKHYLDDFLEFPGYPGLPEREPQIAAIPRFFAEAQRRQFDFSIQLHGSGSFVNSIVVLLGARLNAGFYVPGEYCPDVERFLPFPAGESEIRIMLRLMEFLGAPSQGEALEFPLLSSDWDELNEAASARELLNSDYVCLHPGARFPSRRWPSERFAAVGDALARSGLRVVITGSESELDLAKRVSANMREPHFNYAGHTTLGALGALLSRARLLISNDTGVSHLSAALRVPSVIIVSGSDNQRWAPHDRALHRAVLHPIECRPCMHEICPIGHPCALSVTPAEVLAQATDLIR
jgi:ADP-heptose:LPS heptosyltransferase